jgi:imidazolonepropionase-like amidohydrolase
VSVLIRNGLIEFVGRVDDVALPEGTEVVDAGGGWLVPGFIDVHAHARDTAVIEGLLAAGITTARSASSSVRDGVDYRKVSGGGIEGPRLFSAGPVIDAPPGHWPDAVLVQSEEEVRAAVREQAALGLDILDEGGVRRDHPVFYHLRQLRGHGGAQREKGPRRHRRRG